jgi:hypothetical protein
MRSHPNLEHFLTPTGREIQIYIDRPSQFVRDNQRQLLPKWDKPITQVILILQKSLLYLTDNTSEVVKEKNYLREQFLAFGSKLITRLGDRHKLELFDPQTGYPVFSSRGNLTLNDNALVNALLGFSLIPYQHCSLLIHPQWQTAVYPSTIVSTASDTKLKSTLSTITSSQGWQLLETS